MPVLKWVFPRNPDSEKLETIDWLGNVLKSERINILEILILGWGLPILEGGAPGLSVNSCKNEIVFMLVLLNCA